MAIDSISAAYNKRAEDSLRKPGTYSKTTLDSTDFLKLIAAQLQNQDMTNPMSNSEMMEQLSQMSSIQTMNDLQTAITNMNDIAVRFGKELVIAEVSMGHTVEDYAEFEKLSAENRKGMATKPALCEKVPFPMTEQGQCAFMKAFLKSVEQVPENKQQS